MLRNALASATRTLRQSLAGHEGELRQTFALARGNASMPAMKQVDNETKSFLSGITLGKVMQQKKESGSATANLFWCRPTDTVYDAISKMAAANVGSIFVFTQGGASNKENSVAGLITERDYLRKVVVAGKSSREMTCAALMTPTEQLLTLGPHDSVAKAMQVMEEKNIRHIPVFDHGELVGMMSIKDIMSTIMNEHSRDVTEMSEYIGGNTY
eukprot:TRINITY_DN3729_c0_g1_i1.p2 TRINITY_DN3729_c0_g1~~TRINITY_DN3729_c0_g1_i1.p2  ORF type:complete len:241 (-),score=26.77 TRINITY_DN3729_c0_g1_i1:579-1217(-)